MTTGRIIRGVGGFYYVQTGAEIVECRARGRFRVEGVTPMVGDYVEIRGNAVDRVLPRKNALVRPAVANVDQLIVVLAASHPEPDFLLADKLLISALTLGIRPLIVLNKLDERSSSVYDACVRDYNAAFPLLTISCRTGEGLDALKPHLADRVSCLAGQSAVGKSSLLNALLPALGLPVGDLSKKTERGRHTTRHAELIPCFGGAILDTPGFSLFEAETLTQEALDACYPEFGDAPKSCRFPACSHISEPGCAVKTGIVATGRMSRARYDRYVVICTDFQQRRKHRFD